jgi:hypothetical protein
MSEIKTTYLQELEDVDLARISDLEFLVFANTPYLTGIMGDNDPHLHKRFFYNHEKGTRWFRSDGIRSIVLLDKGLDQQMVMEEWDGSKRNVLLGKHYNVTSSMLLPSNRSLSFFDKDFLRTSQFGIHDFQRAHHMEALTFNASSYLLCRGFDGFVIFDLDGNIKLRFPGGDDNERSRGVTNQFTIHRNGEDFLFGYTSPNSQKTFSFMSGTTAFPENMLIKRAGLPELPNHFPLTRQVGKNLYRMGSFYMVDKDFNATTIPRKALNIKEESVVEAVEKHEIANHQYIVILEKTVQDEGILHIYNEALQEIKRLDDYDHMIDEWCAMYSGNTLEKNPGGVMMYISKKISKYNGHDVHTAKILDPNFDALFTIPFYYSVKRKATLDFGGKTFIVGSPYYNGFHLYDFNGNLVFNERDGEVSDLDALIHAKDVENYAVIKNNGHDLLVISEHGSKDMNVYDENFQKASIVEIGPNKGIPNAFLVRKPVGVCLIPLLQYANHIGQDLE